MQKDFEPVLERQVHHFIKWRLRHSAYRPARHCLGAHFQCRSRQRFQPGAFRRSCTRVCTPISGAIVDKVQVTIYTDPDKLHEWLTKAREAYDFRNKRLRRPG